MNELDELLDDIFTAQDWELIRGAQTQEGWEELTGINETVVNEMPEEQQQHFRKWWLFKK
jgi:hypothetical protein